MLQGLKAVLPDVSSTAELRLRVAALAHPTASPPDAVGADAGSQLPSRDSGVAVRHKAAGTTSIRSLFQMVNDLTCISIYIGSDFQALSAILQHANGLATQRQACWGLIRSGPGACTLLQTLANCPRHNCQDQQMHDEARLNRSVAAQAAKLRAEGRAGAAAHVLRRILELEPNNSRAHFALGQV